ncbi:TPA: hypothetical protein KPD61_002275 [Clostridioides difficile]|nr:hypothetical protein [Clostridioides difficile]HBG5769082.1 hypothetical protein [Clostridioides difficile]
MVTKISNLDCNYCYKYETEETGNISYDVENRLLNKKINYRIKEIGIYCTISW